MNAAIRNRTAAALALLLSGAASLGQAASLNLGGYTLTGVYNLPAVTASEASAITYNWDTDTLFVVGDEGEALVEVSRTGQQLSAAKLTGFDDTEGLTYMGGGQFVVAEERLRNLYQLTYQAGTVITRSDLAYVSLGDTVGNIGIEGVSYDPRDGSFVTVKEKTPQEVNLNTVTFGTPGSADVVSLFSPAALGVSDLSDVQVLATVLAGADADNLLIFSQESARLLEVDRSGNILSSFDFSGLSDSAEGVTIDAAGNIYVVAENGSNPQLFALAPAPVPLPAAAWLFGGALAACAGVVRRRRS